MSLFIRVDVGFWTHRKTLRLRAAIGDAAFWIPPRLWSYAAQNQPDGDFSAYLPAEIAMLVGCTTDAEALLQALQHAGFMDGMKIHAWADHNGYHEKFAQRAKKAAAARWRKRGSENERRGEETTGDEKRGQEKKQAMLGLEVSNATSILVFLNETAGRKYRPIDAHLKFITARLSEQGVTVEEVKKMLVRQCKEWKGTDMDKYLRPETLFNATKFAGYYDARDLPIREPSSGSNGRPKNIHDDAELHKQKSKYGW